MTKNKKLIVGFLALVLVWVVMLWFKWDAIEEDIASRVGRALKDEGFHWAEVVTADRGRNVQLSGVVREESQIQKARDIAERVYGVRLVDSSLVDFRPYKPATLSFAVRDAGAVLSGKLQHQEHVDSLVKMVESIYGGTVDNQTMIDSDIGEPGWFRSIGNILGALKQVEDLAFGIENQSLKLSGLVRTNGTYKAVLDAVSTLDSITTVDGADLVLQPYKPSWFRIRSGDGGLELTGSVNQRQEADLLDGFASQLGGTTIADEVEVATHYAPATWVEDLPHFVPGMMGLERAGIEFSGDTFSVSGLVRTQEQLGQLQVIEGQLGDRRRLDLSALRFKPYQTPSFSMHVDQGRVSVSGRLSSEEQIKRVNTALKEVFDTDQPHSLILDSDVSEAEWISDLVPLLSALKGLEKSATRISGGEIKVSGLARYRNAYEAVVGFADNSDGEVVNDVVFRPWKEPTLDITVNGSRLMAADGAAAANPVPVLSAVAIEELASLYPDVNQDEMVECEQEMDRRMFGKKIEFEFASSALSPNSFSLLDNILAAITACPAVTIEIAGHTDNVGSDETNLILSEKRALSVAEYLIKSGAPPDKISPKGFGSAQPIGDNNTEEGRAANRRIEFNIKTKR